MLEPPITQADIDNRTLFRTRDGRTATIEHHCSNPLLDCWVWGDCHHVRSDGRVFGYTDTISDLISRIKEPAMQSQVIVEDRRDIKTEDDGWLCIDEIKGQTLFIERTDKGQPPYVYLKVYGNHVVSLRDGHFSYHDATNWLVKPLYGVRLRMILEDKPCT